MIAVGIAILVLYLLTPVRFSGDAILVALAVASVGDALRSARSDIAESIRGIG